MFNPLSGLGDLQKLQHQAQQMQAALQQEEVVVEKNGVKVVVRGDQGSRHLFRRRENIELVNVELRELDDAAPDLLNQELDHEVGRVGRVHLNEAPADPRVALMVRLQTEILLRFGVQMLIVPLYSLALQNTKMIS